MIPLIEALERLDAELAAADPGDAPGLSRLLTRRAELVSALSDEAQKGAAGPEILYRLRAVSTGAAPAYRALTLYRLLVLQQLADLGRRKALLQAFSPSPSGQQAGFLVTTSV